MFRASLSPILRSTNNCNYSVTIRITKRCAFFVLCLYFLFLVLSLHVSGLHGPIIRGISSCCFYATIWFMQCFVEGLRASADWFVVVTSVYCQAFNVYSVSTRLFNNFTVKHIYTVCVVSPQSNSSPRHLPHIAAHSCNNVQTAKT